MTVLVQRPAPTETRAAARDPHAWEARVRRTLRPVSVEVVDGSAEQRHRLAVAGVRRGTFRRPAGTASTADLSALSLDELLLPELRERCAVDAAAGPGTPEPASEERREAAAVRVMTGASRGRTAWLAPFAADGSQTGGPQLGVLLTDSPVAVLALLEEAHVGPAALARIETGEPWTAVAHSVGLPLDDEHGLPLREDAPWPGGTRLLVRLRGGAEVWSCGSPVAWT